MLGLFVFGRYAAEVNNVRNRTFRKLAGRKFEPCLGLLEKRFTPAVTTMSVAGLTPGAGGGNTVFIGGIVDDSSSNSATSLSVSYKVTDSQGNVLAGGPLTVSPSSPGSLNFGFGTTIPRSVSPGNFETITVFATDADSMGVPRTSTANLYVSTVKGLSTLGFGLNAKNGDVFGGSGQGKISLTQSASRGLIVRGKSSFQLGSAPGNQTLLTETASGPFQFAIDPQGDMSLTITRGKANFKLGSYAGGALSKGGIGGVVAGNFSFSRFIDTSIVAQGQGSDFI
jgi:hypothetical protein